MLDEEREKEREKAGEMEKRNCWSKNFFVENFQISACKNALNPDSAHTVPGITKYYLATF